MIDLNHAQGLFLTGLNTKYRAYIGGFGCLHGDTRIWSEHGLIKIKDINQPMMVLSYSIERKRLELALTGGSFIKGKDRLLNVNTGRGSFECNKFHACYANNTYETGKDDYDMLGRLTSRYDKLKQVSGYTMQFLRQNGAIDFPVCSGRHYDPDIIDSMRVGLNLGESVIEVDKFYPDSSEANKYEVNRLNTLQLINSYPITIYRKEIEEEYYDMQVLDNNNYIDEFGSLHHNSGKTFVGCLDLLLFAKAHPNLVQGYFGPTYPSITDIFFPTVEEAGELLKIKTECLEAKKEVNLYTGKNNLLGSIKCRSMDNPDKIVGFKIARALVDEIDVLATNKAERAWNKIIARMRLKIPGIVNGIGVTCTPEGFGFIYRKFKKAPSQSYSMVQASSYENGSNLPDDYIATLYESYPIQLVNAYIMGEFVNLASGTVYYPFDRVKHRTDMIQSETDKLHIGMDFNVNDMCGSIHVEKDGISYAVGELFGLKDTEHMIKAIKERYPKNIINVYPDASGKATSSKSASLTDITLLNNAGFNVRASKKNPLIKDRVASVNKRIETGKYLVNVDLCPELTLSLEQQCYDEKTNQPEKNGKLDNRLDGMGYYIHYCYPVIRKSFTSVKSRGF